MPVKRCLSQKLYLSAIFLLVLLISGAGVSRLHFETEILEVLPQKIGAVQALQDFSHHFADERQVIVLLKAGGHPIGDDDDGNGSDEEEVTVEDAESLAMFLRDKFPEAEVRYQSSFEENPELFAGSVARIWSCAPPEQVEALVAVLGDRTKLDAHLAQVKSDLQNSFNQEKAMTQAYDPLGFLQHPAMLSLMESEMSFSSDNDRLRMLMIRRDNESDISYKVDAEWVADIEEQLGLWRARMSGEGTPFATTLTGGPVFNAEIGTGMEKDMKGTITMTSLLIAALFLLVQRNWKQLLLISGLLGLTFLITLGIAGWLIGTLNLVSVGFAAILLGLVIDYAVVIARESHLASRASTLRKLVAPSILWAAASTALVFGVLTMSTFTGVQQLGALVMIGLLSGAIVMLVITPWFFEKFPTNPPTTMMSPIFLPSSQAWKLPLALILLATCVFFIKGRPQVSFDLKMVEPESSQAAHAFGVIQDEFSAWSDQNVILLTSADSIDALKKRVAQAQVELKHLHERGDMVSVQWPIGLIPDPVAYQANRSRLKKLTDSQEWMMAQATSAGFSEAGLSLDRAILTAIQRQATSDEDLIPSSAEDELIGMFFAIDDGGRYFFSGRMLMVNRIGPEDVEKFDGLKRCSVHVTGWSMLQAILLPHVKRDFYVIFIPAALLLLVALMFVFRKWRDTLISISVLVTSLVAINALVVMTGQSWNFLSGMAIPLIVGAGIDYSIHLIFALRRLDGDVVAVWNGVGKAICFCGVSTAVGFSSLLFASNKMLQSMGLLCSVGVLLTMILSLLVIPGMWLLGEKRRLSMNK